MILSYTVKNNSTIINVKQILKNEFLLSDRLIRKLKLNNKIYINSIPVSVNFKVNTNDVIIVNIDFEEDNSNIVPTKMDLDIIYEDSAYLIINKPAGISTHPSCLHYTNSLSNGIKYYFDSIDLKKKIRPVNRLDKNTSGIVVFAKNEYIQECLIQQMQNNIFQKKYVAILSGILEKSVGTINAPIARKNDSIIERCISTNGNKSITEYKVIQTINNNSLVLFKLKTGRTHQIRVHSQYLGHPILGDTLYGNSSSIINRQALHSYKINFIHPISKEKVTYIAPLPNDMSKIILPYFNNNILV